MPETTAYITGIEPASPDGGDSKSNGDNEIRQLKIDVQGSFPNVGGAVTATHSELNILDDAVVTTADLDKLGEVTATSTELNTLDGVTATYSELNILAGTSTTTSELNNLPANTTSDLAGKAALAGSIGQKFNVQDAGTTTNVAITSHDYATNTFSGTVKMHRSGTTLYLSNDSGNAS